VLALEWLDPPYAPGHWVPELIAAAGGELLAGIACRPSYRLEWGELPALRADVVVVMPCGFDLPAAEAEVARFAERLHGLAPRVVAVDASSYFSRSGPRVVDGIELLERTIFSH
jgi:iron complex transport system substrate-binding protein